MAKSGSIGIGYTRKSVVRGRSDETSVERQDANLRRTIEADGLTPEIHTDAEGHRSGRSDRYRPAWRAVLRRIPSPDVRAIYVDSLSRAWRSVKGWNELLDLCRKHDVALRVLKEGIDTGSKFGAMQKGMSDIFATVAEMESNLASERMADNIAYLKANGVYWGQTPFGFVRTGEGLDAWLRPLVPHDETVRMVLRLVSAGLSNARVAEHLSARSVRFVDRTGVPGPFTNETIRTIARNVLTYAGYVIERGGRAKARQITLAGSGSLIDQYALALDARRGQIEPVIDNHLASQVIEKLLNPANSGRRPGEWIALLTPRLWCVHERGRDKLYAQAMPHGHFYRSRKRSGVVLDADALDSLVLSRLCGVAFPPAIRADIRQAIDDREHASTIARLRSDKRRLERIIDNLTDMAAAGDITREEFRRRRDDAQRELAEIERRLNAPGQVDILVEAFNDLGALLKLAAPGQAKSAVAAMFDRFEVNAEGEIVRIELARWAREAFGELAWAIRPAVSRNRIALTTVPPTGLQDVVDKLNDDTCWLIRLALAA